MLVLAVFFFFATLAAFVKKNIYIILLFVDIWSNILREETSRNKEQAVFFFILSKK